MVTLGDIEAFLRKGDVRVIEKLTRSKIGRPHKTTIAVLHEIREKYRNKAAHEIEFSHESLDAFRKYLFTDRKLKLLLDDLL
jgi:hypothetical protein